MSNLQVNSPKYERFFDRLDRLQLLTKIPTVQVVNGMFSRIFLDRKDNISTHFELPGFNVCQYFSVNGWYTTLQHRIQILILIIKPLNAVSNVYLLDTHAFFTYFYLQNIYTRGIWDRCADIKVKNLQFAFNTILLLETNLAILNVPSSATSIAFVVVVVVVCVFVCLWQQFTCTKINSTFFCVSFCYETCV